MTNPLQTQKVNIEMVIGQLGQERNKKAADFSKEIKEWAQVIQQKQDEYDKLCYLIEKEDEKLRKQQEAFLKSVQVCTGKIQSLNYQCDAIKADKRKTIRIIESVNLRIITAEEYFAKLEVNIQELEDKTSDLEKLGELRDGLAVEVEDLRGRNNELMGNRIRLRKEISAISNTLQAQITEAHEKMVLYEDKANQAESKMHMFVDEFIRKTKDLEILKQRIEAVYSGVFPGAHVNLR